jgi:hypothetical protein
VLPFAEGFWNNNPIIHENLIFTLQNCTYGDDLCTEKIRKILVFDGDGWKALN